MGCRVWGDIDYSQTGVRKETPDLEVGGGCRTGRWELYEHRHHGCSCR